MAAEASSSVQTKWIANGNLDIVQNEYLVKYRSGMTGRQRLQTIHVRLSDGGKSWTTTGYDSEADAGPDHRNASLKPTEEELKGDDKHTPVLVVGLLLPLTPQKYCSESKGKSRNAELEKERANLPVQDSDQGFLRVVVPKTRYIKSSIKYYVACNSVHGFCGLRLIAQNTVFYFDEIWQEVNMTQNIKTRRTALSAACKRVAATYKHAEQRAAIPVAGGGWEKSSLLSVPPNTDFTRRLVMQASMYTINPLKSILAASLNTIEESLPDIAHTRFSKGNVGITAFSDFEQTLQEEDARLVVKEFQEMNPTLYKDLDPRMVSKVHSILMEHELGDRLSYHGIGIFLESCQRKCGLYWDKGMALPTIMNILEDHEKLFQAGFHLTPSNLTGEKIEKDPFRSWLMSYRDDIVSYNQWLSEYAKQMKTQHGALDNSINFDTLMTRVGDCIDIEALKNIFEQGMAIHADQWAAAHMEAHERTKELIKSIDELLTHAFKQSG